MVKIKLERDYPGAGDVGDVIDVSPERADRWCGEGIAVLGDEKPKRGAGPKKGDEKPGAKEGEK